MIEWGWRILFIYQKRATQGHTLSVRHERRTLLFRPLFVFLHNKDEGAKNRAVWVTLFSKEVSLGNVHGEISRNFLGKPWWGSTSGYINVKFPRLTPGYTSGTFYKSLILAWS